MTDTTSQDHTIIASSHCGPEPSSVARRDLCAGLFGVAAGTAGLLGGLLPNDAFAQSVQSSRQAANLTNQKRRFGIFGPKKDLFANAMAASTGAPAARFSDFAIRTPEGRPVTLRVSWPVETKEKLNVLLVSPAGTTSPSRYDMLSGSLAGQGYFVITLNHSEALTNRESALRRAAEARFVLDNVSSIRAVLATDAKLVDSDTCGVVGHMDGAWTALGLAGWATDLSACDALRDGRVRAGYGLAPNRPPVRLPFPSAKTAGARGMVAGRLESLPLPPPGSGLLGLGLPLATDNFSGLIGPTNARITSPSARRPEELAAASAAAILFFDWMLKGEDDAKDQLMALEGRTIPGLNGAMRVRRA